MSPRSIYQPGILEMHREDLRQLVAVSARFPAMDLRHRHPRDPGQLGKTAETARRARPGIRRALPAAARVLPQPGPGAGHVFLLVYAVLLIEFRSLLEPLAIVMGAVWRCSASSRPCGSPAPR